jgi:DNA-binding transcriptional MerR regulator
MLKGNGAFIGEIARRTRLSIHTIRFYEAQGLLPDCARADSGFRVFPSETVERLKFIRKAKELGFSLNEIRDLAVLRDRSAAGCLRVTSLVDEKLELVRSKQRELFAIEKELKRVRAECNRQLKRRRVAHAQGCPVLQRLGRES